MRNLFKFTLDSINSFPDPQYYAVASMKSAPLDVSKIEKKAIKLQEEINNQIKEKALEEIQKKKEELEGEEADRVFEKITVELKEKDSKEFIQTTEPKLQAILDKIATRISAGTLKEKDEISRDELSQMLDSENLNDSALLRSVNYKFDRIKQSTIYRLIGIYQDQKKKYQPKELNNLLQKRYMSHAHRRALYSGFEGLDQEEAKAEINPAELEKFKALLDSAFPDIVDQSPKKKPTSDWYIVNPKKGILLDLFKEGNLEEIKNLIQNYSSSTGLQKLTNFINVAVIPTPSVVVNFRLVKNLGIRELITIKTDIIKYIRKEVAHIENVLAGEERRRKHSVTVLKEQEITQTEFIEKIKQTDTQTTDTSSVEKEISKEVEQAYALSASLSVTYEGPSYTAQTDIDGSLEGRNASKYTSAQEQSSEIINKAVSSVRQSMETVSRFLYRTETKEKTEHIQTAGASNIIGIYQYLEAEYISQMYLHGAYLLYEVTVPEPGFSLREQEPAGEPATFKLRHTDIARNNFAEKITEYKAFGVESPPEEILEESFNTERLPNGSGQTLKVSIPQKEGYLTKRVIIRPNTWDSATNVTENSERYVFIAVANHHRVLYPNGQGNPWGTHVFDMVPGDDYSISAGSLSISFYNKNVGRAEYHIKAIYELKKEVFEAWQLSVWQACLESFQQKQKIEQIIPPKVQSPLKNRMQEKAEIIRLCKFMIARKHLSNYDGYVDRSQQFPGINYGKWVMDSEEINFLNQAIVWELLTYALTDYDTSKFSNWANALNFNTNDFLRDQFLAAGSARVQLPVRIGWEDMLEQYLNTGQVPSYYSSDEFVFSENYLTVVDEVRQARGALKGTPVGDPDYYRLPFAVTILRDTPDLPEWAFNEDKGYSEEVESGA